MSVPAQDKRKVRITKTSTGEWLPYLVPGVSISKKQNSRDTCGFQLRVSEASKAPLVEGEEITIEAVAPDGSVSTVYGGTVEAIDLSDPTGQRTITLTYDVVDFNRILDRFLVPETYSDATLSAIVNDLITKYLAGEGITAGTIATGPTLERIVFSNYPTATAALDELSEITGFFWNVGYDKALDVFARADNDAPWSIAPGSLKYQRMKVRRSRTQYRNRQYVRGGKDLTDEQIETLVGDGERRVFTLGFEVGTAPTVEVDTGGGFVAQTVGIQGVSTGKQFYWNKGQKEIVQDQGEPVLESTHTLRVSYEGLFRIFSQGEDADAIADRKAIEGGTGIYEHIIDEESIDRVSLATDRTTGLLRRYGSIDETVTFDTLWPGLEPGQILPIEVPLLSLDGDYLIDSVSARLNERRELQYSVTALSGEQVGDWRTFFREMLSAGRKFVINENEVLIVLRAIDETVEVSEEVVVTEGAFTWTMGQTRMGFHHMG